MKRSQRSVYRVIAEIDRGRIFEFAEEWCDMGRPKIMNDDEVDLFTESVRKNPGEKNMRECVLITLLRTLGLDILWIVHQDAFLSQVGC